MYKFARKLFHCYGLVAARHSATELATSSLEVFQWGPRTERATKKHPEAFPCVHGWGPLPEYTWNNLHNVSACTCWSYRVPSVVFAEGRLFLSCSYSSTCCQQKLSNLRIFNFCTTFANLSARLYCAASSTQCILVPVQNKFSK